MWVLDCFVFPGPLLRIKSIFLVWSRDEFGLNDCLVYAPVDIHDGRLSIVCVCR